MTYPLVETASFAKRKLVVRQAKRARPFTEARFGGDENPLPGCQGVWGLAPKEKPPAKNQASSALELAT